MKSNKIIIATGGTGGHVFPALSLANHFIENNLSVKIISDQRGYRYLKNYKNIDVKIISSATIFKKNIFSSIFSIFIILIAFIKSLFFLIKNRPKIVFGMGGYSSFPVCIAAKTLAIPFIIYENNLYLGKTNRYLLPLSYKMFISYLSLEGINPKYKSKCFETGNIIRQDILELSKIDYQSETKKINFLILGGSQAAKVFAEKLPKIFKLCVDNKIKIKIYQQCLENQNKKLEYNYKLFGLEYEIFNFTHNITKYFEKADIAITRSGSSMLAELLNCKIPIINIPLPSSAENHQLKNAQYFEKKGYGYLIEEKKLEEMLFPLIKSIHEDKNLLNQMKKNQSTFSDKKVYEKINKQIKELIYE